MIFTIRFCGLDLLQIESHHDEAESDMDDRLTFGFASCTGSHDISDDRMLDTSDRG